MNINFKLVFFLLILATFWACQEDKDSYLYADTEASIDMDIMSLLKEEPNYSKYVNLLERHNMDTLFQQGKTLTLFVPTNEAFDEIEELYLDTIDLIKYSIVESYINMMAIDNLKKVKTLGGKFVVLQSFNDQKFIDDVVISKAGPLCQNGKYYEIEKIVQPLPNLYEYIQATNPFFINYIKLQDSVYLDLEFSTPIGYNELGQTVYDSVLSVINLFEDEYYPVSTEFRTKRATMLLFDQMQFDNALSIIAEDLHLDSKDAIPDQWKNDILLPYLINQGIFWNELSFGDFATGRIRNIIGDSVNVNPANINPQSEFLCSNGKVFNYMEFVVPDSLYKGKTRIQGEDLVVLKGLGEYTWAPDIIVTGPPVKPVALLAIDIADNDSLLVVNFGSDSYAEEFSFSFKVNNIFPGLYRLIWRGKSTPSGIFEIYVNGELQAINLGKGSKDFVDLYDLRNPVRSFTNTEVFRPDKGFNSFDVLVENITEYGNVEITIKYKEPGQRSDNGFVLDYIDLESYTAE